MAPAGPVGTLDDVAILRMFASAREAAGTARDEVPGATVGEVLGAARRRYGDGFADVLATCRIWVNGDPADEDAALPPVSGGAT
jgi:molybdopterin converting factor small subunit